MPQQDARVISGIPLTVRLELRPRVLPDGPAVADPDKPPIRRQIARRAGISLGRKLTAPPAEIAAASSVSNAALALPRVPDPTVYTARDLDSYPMPLVPLDIARLEELAAGKSVSIRIELIVDEHGIVNDVALAGPGPAGFPETELRAMLAAARFVPARKDGRAVKCRVRLSVGLRPSY